jgi:hypothetical protein
MFINSRLKILNSSTHIVLIAIQMVTHKTINNIISSAVPIGWLHILVVDDINLPPSYEYDYEVTSAAVLTVAAYSPTLAITLYFLRSKLKVYSF